MSGSSSSIAANATNREIATAGSMPIIDDYWTIDSSRVWGDGANWYQTVSDPQPQTLHVQPGVNNDAEIEPSGTTNFVITYDETDTVNALDGNDYATLALTGGALTVEAGGVWGGGFFNSDGTFDAVDGWAAYGNTGLAAGATDEVDSGIFSVGAGALAGNIIGAGEFLLLGGNNFTLDPGISITAGTFDLAVNGDGFGSDTTLAVNLDYAGTFLLNNSNGNNANLYLNGHTLTLSGTQNLNGYIAGSGELVLAGTAEIPGLIINDSATVAVSGTVLQSGGLTTGTGATPDDTLLEIEKSGTWNITADTGIAGYGGTAIVNAGLLEKTGGTGASYFGGSVFTDTGKIMVKTGELVLDSSNNLLSGRISGAGEIVFQGGDNFTLAPGISITAGTLNLSVNGDGFVSNTTLGVNLDYAHTFMLSDAYGNNANLFLNGHTLALSGKQILNGYISGSGELALAGSADLIGLIADNSATVAVSGIVKQTGGLTMGDGTAPDHALLTISGTGKWDILADTGIAGYGDTTIINDGLLEKTGGTATSEISDSGLMNNGTILTDKGLLNLQSPVVNDGTIETSHSGTIMISGAMTGEGVIIDDTTVSLNGSVGSGQTVDFTGTSSVLNLGDPQQFQGTLAGFNSADTIDFTNISYASNGTASLNASTDKLSVVESGVTYALQLTGNYAGDSFHLSSDHASGTDITVSGSSIAAGLAITGKLFGFGGKMNFLPASAPEPSARQNTAHFANMDDGAPGTTSIKAASGLQHILENGIFPYPASTNSNSPGAFGVAAATLLSRHAWAGFGVANTNHFTLPSV